MSDLSFGRKRRRRINYDLIQNVVVWIVQIAVVCAFAYVLVWCFGQKVSVIGDSMNPELENGDITIMNQLSYKIHQPKRGDVIAFKPNGNKNSHYYIKRVIGLPGESIEYKDGVLLVDGEEIEEDYETTKIEELGLLEDKIILDESEFFVLGDDRQNSEDSRSANIGEVKLSEIEGKVWFVVSPMKHLGFVN